MAQRLAEQMKNLRIPVAVHHTTGRGDAERAARDAASAAQDRPAVVVACGGDGTVQEVVNGLMAVASPPCLGLAPAGRCNDFARALHVASDLDAITCTLLDGDATPVDLGRVNGRFFCTVATAGIDAEVTNFVDCMRMPLRGTPAYLYGAVRVLMRYRPWSMRLTGDFGVIDRPLLLASSANTASYGGAIRIAPHAVPTDGWLDVCVVDPMSRLRILRLLPALLAGRHGDRSEVQFLRTTRLSLDTDELIDLWADGERIARTPALIEVVPHALLVLTPKQTALHAGRGGE